MELEEQRRQQAFDQLVRPEIPVLLRVARTLADQPADAEDLVQDALMRAYRSLDGFDGRHPRAWLLTILRNTQINRTRRRRPQPMEDGQLERAADRAGPAGDPPEEVVEQGFDAAVENALAALPTGFRRAVELVDVGGLTYAEAGRALGIAAGTVMSRVHRARTRMRKQLAQAGLGPKEGR